MAAIAAVAGMMALVSRPLQLRPAPLRSHCLSCVASPGDSQLPEFKRGQCEPRYEFALLNAQIDDAEKYSSSALGPMELADAYGVEAAVDGVAAAEVKVSHTIAWRAAAAGVPLKAGWHSHLRAPVFGGRLAVRNKAARAAPVRCSLLGGLSDSTPEGNAETFVVGQKVKVSQSVTFMHVPGNKGGFDAKGLTGTVLRVYTEANLSSNREIKVQFDEPKKWIGHLEAWELQSA